VHFSDFGPTRPQKGETGGRCPVIEPSGDKSRLQAGRNRVLAPESIAYEFQIFSELDFGAILGLILNSSRVFACAEPHRVRNRNIDPKSRPRTRTRIRGVNFGQKSGFCRISRPFQRETVGEARAELRVPPSLYIPATFHSSTEAVPRGVLPRG
jgi:hypothetical protein